MHSFSKTPEPKAPLAATGPVSGVKSLPSTTSPSISVQAKLEVTEPGDSYEMEADAMADLAISRVSSPLSGSPNGTALSSSLSPASMVSRLPSGHSSVTVSPALESAISSSKGGGFALPASLKGQMESGFGADFSDVRLHTGPDASSMSSSIQAKAFTSGKDIYFNEGQFNPDTTDGQRIIAHELAHTLQQSGMVARSPMDNEESDEDNTQQQRKPQSIAMLKKETNDMIKAGFNSYEMIQMLEYAVQNPYANSESYKEFLPFIRGEKQMEYAYLYIHKIQRQVRRGDNVDDIISQRKSLIRDYFPLDNKECNNRIKTAVTKLLAKGISGDIVVNHTNSFLNNQSICSIPQWTEIDYAIEYALRTGAMSHDEVKEAIQSEIGYQVRALTFNNDSALSKLADTYNKMQNVKKDSGLMYHMASKLVDFVNANDVEEIQNAASAYNELLRILTKDHKNNDDYKEFDQRFYQLFKTKYDPNKIEEAETAYALYSRKLAAVEFYSWADRQLCQVRDNLKYSNMAKIYSESITGRNLSSYSRVPGTASDDSQRYDFEAELKKTIIYNIEKIFHTKFSGVMASLGCDADDLSAKDLEQYVIPQIRKYLLEQYNNTSGGQSISSLEKDYKQKSLEAYGAVFSESIAKAKTIMIATQFTEMALNIGVGIALGICGGSVALSTAQFLRLGTTATKALTVVTNGGLSLGFDLIIDPITKKQKMTRQDIGFAVLSAVLGAAVDWKTFKPGLSYRNVEIRNAKGKINAADQNIANLKREQSSIINTADKGFNQKLANESAQRSETIRGIENQAVISNNQMQADLLISTRDANVKYDSKVNNAKQRNNDRVAEADSTAEAQRSRQDYLDLKGKAGLSTNTGDTVYADSNQISHILQFDNAEKAISSAHSMKINTSQRTLTGEIEEAMSTRVVEANANLTAFQTKIGMPEEKIIRVTGDTIDDLNTYKPILEQINKYVTKLKNEKIAKLPPSLKTVWEKDLKEYKARVNTEYSGKIGSAVADRDELVKEFKQMFPEQYLAVNMIATGIKTIEVSGVKIQLNHDSSDISSMPINELRFVLICRLMDVDEY